MFQKLKTKPTFCKSDTKFKLEEKIQYTIIELNVLRIVGTYSIISPQPEKIFSNDKSSEVKNI